MSKRLMLGVVAMGICMGIVALLGAGVAQADTITTGMFRFWENVRVKSVLAIALAVIRGTRCSFGVTAK